MHQRNIASIVLYLAAWSVANEAPGQLSQGSTTPFAARSSGVVIEPATWRIEVLSEGRTETRFEAAIAHDGGLELVQESTPYAFEFVGTRVTALFEAEADTALRVNYYHDAQGELRLQGAFAGSDRGHLRVNLNDPIGDRFGAEF